MDSLIEQFKKLHTPQRANLMTDNIVFIYIKIENYIPNYINYYDLISPVQEYRIIGYN